MFVLTALLVIAKNCDATVIVEADLRMIKYYKQQNYKFNVNIERKGRTTETTTISDREFPDNAIILQEDIEAGSYMWGAKCRRIEKIEVLVDGKSCGKMITYKDNESIKVDLRSCDAVPVPADFESESTTRPTIEQSGDEQPLDPTEDEHEEETKYKDNLNNGNNYLDDINEKEKKLDKKKEDEDEDEDDDKDDDYEDKDDFKDDLDNEAYNRKHDRKDRSDDESDDESDDKSHDGTYNVPRDAISIPTASYATYPQANAQYGRDNSEYGPQYGQQYGQQLAQQYAAATQHYAPQYGSHAPQYASYAPVRRVKQSDYGYQ